MKDAILAASIVTLVAACAGPQPSYRTQPEPVRSAAPTWQHQPLSWSKLEAIEDWLNDRNAPADLRSEAQLQLAEGRLTFARSGTAHLDPSVLQARLDSAEHHFAVVLNDPGVRPEHRQRAADGLRALRELKTGSSSPAPTGALARAQWGAAAPAPSRLTPHSGRYDRITVHHSAMSASELRRASLPTTADHLQRIQRNHMRDEGMGDIGYHFIIDPAGRVLEGRSLRWQGAHSGGANNVRNVGVCLLGNFDRERPTPEADRALTGLLASLRKQHGIPVNRVFGHRELKTTQCPGTHLTAWLGRYRSGVAPVFASAAPKATVSRRAASSPAKVR